MLDIKTAKGIAATVEFLKTTKVATRAWHLGRGEEVEEEVEEVEEQEEDSN